jgi:hypothetical protein
MRPATVTDIPAVRTVLARAFFDDPLFEWIFTGVEPVVEATAAWLSIFVESYVTNGQTTVAEAEGRIVGAAMWRHLNDPTAASEPVLPTLPGLGRSRSSGTGTRSSAGPRRRGLGHLTGGRRAPRDHQGHERHLLSIARLRGDRRA